MSYTPADQLMVIPLLKASDALDTLSKPIKERLKDTSEWTKEHLIELKNLLVDITELESRMRILAEETR